MMQSLAVDKAGNVWDTSDPANPKFVSGPSTGAKAGQVFSLPQTPEEQRKESRAEEDQRLQREAAARSAEAAGRSAGSQERQAKVAEATLGNQQFDNVQKLRSAYESQPIVKEYRVVLTQLGSALQRANDATGDNALIYDYAKAMDPGSVVREGEMTMASSGSPAWEAAAANLKKQFGIEGGGQLPPEIRERLKREIANKASVMNVQYSAQRQRYAKDANANGFDPAQVIGNHDGDAVMPLIKQYEEQQHHPLNGQVGETTGPSGNTSSKYDPRFSAQIDSLINAGASLATVNAAAQKRGFPTVNAGDFAAAKAWMKANPGKRYFGATMSKNEPLSTGQQVLAAMGPTAGAIATGVANYGNTAAAGIPKLLAGQAGQGNLDAANTLYPNAAVTGEVAGGVTGALGLERGLANGIIAAGKGGTEEAASLLLKSAPHLASTIYGGTLGMTSAPDGQGLWGAVKGAGLGLVGSAAGSLAGKAIGSLVSRYTGGYLTPAERSLSSAMAGKADTIQPMLSEADRLNLPLALGDTTPELQALTGAVSRKSVHARGVAEEILDPRARGQAERAYEAIDTHLAPVTDVGQRGTQHIADARSASRPHYQAAEAQPAPTDSELMTMLDTPDGAAAARKAYNIALNNGENPAELSFAKAADGTPIITANPNYKTLHYMKMGLDSTVEGSRDLAGNLNLADPYIRSVNDLRGRLVQRLGELNPDYRAANAAYAERASLKTGLDNGLEASGSNMPHRDLVNVMGGLKEPQVPEFQRGYATGLSDQVGNKNLSGNPYDRIFGSTNQQAKIGTVFPQGAKDFGKVNDFERMMAKTRNEVLGGSPTAGRLQADSQLTGGLATAALDLGSQLATGGGVNFGSLLKAGLQHFGDTAKLGIGKAAVQRADELAPVLLNTAPADMTAYLDDLLARQAKRAAAQRDGGRLGTALGAALGAPLIIGQ